MEFISLDLFSLSYVVTLTIALIASHFKFRGNVEILRQWVNSMAQLRILCPAENCGPYISLSCAILCLYWLDVLLVTQPTLPQHYRKCRALTPTSGLASSFLYPPPVRWWKRCFFFYAISLVPVLWFLIGPCKKSFACTYLLLEWSCTGVVVCVLTADGSSVSSTPATTRKKKEDKETTKSAVRARYLMEKYGTRWRSKVAAGVYWSLLNNNWFCNIVIIYHNTCMHTRTHASTPPLSICISREPPHIQTSTFLWMLLVTMAQSFSDGIAIRLWILLHFYCAMHYSAKHGLEIACRLSVYLSVCLWCWWIMTT